MNRFLSIAVILSALVSTNANAWFFFFLPGAVTGKIADAFTGAEGDNCVGPNSKVGDNIRLPNGDVKSITSLSGTSTRCTNPEMPIRALLGNASITLPTHVSKAGIDLTDAWAPRPITDAMKSGGSLLMAANRTTDTGLLLSATPHQGISDMMAYAVARRSGQAGRMTDAQQSEISQSVINGVPVWRFTVSGKVKDGTQITYLWTIFDSDKEIVTLNTWTTSANFPAQREAMEKLSDRINGLPTSTPIVVGTVASPQVAATSSAPATPSLPVPVVEKPTAPVVVAPASPVAATQSTSSEKSPKPQGSIAVRLADLKKLHEEGLITDKEYESKKQEILGTL